MISLSKMKKKHINVRFPKKKEVGKRKWGKEILLSLIPKILSLKLLKLKKGKKGGVQYHHKKMSVDIFYQENY